MKIAQDKLTFESSGRSFYANGNLVGIGPCLVPTEGYDGGVGFNDGSDFTQAERWELAHYMIGLWTQFAEGAAVVA